MSARARLIRVYRRDHLEWLGRLLLLGVVGVLVYLAVRVIAMGPELSAVLRRESSIAMLIVAMLLYLAAHAFRILRLALLIGGWRVGFRDVASFHLTTSAFSLAVPLKLGDLYRLVELARIAGGFLRAVVIEWCTRAFDTVVILLMLVVALSRVPGATAEFGAVAALAAVFVASTAIVLFIVPDNLRRLAVFIVRRHDSRSTVPVLQAIEAVRRAILEAPEIVESKVASIAALTALIWVCEVLSFAVAVPAIGGSLDAALEGLLTFLSAITRGETLLTALDGEGATLAGQLLVYLAVTQVPLVFLSLFAAAHYTRLRLHS